MFVSIMNKIGLTECSGLIKKSSIAEDSELTLNEVGWLLLIL